MAAAPAPSRWNTVGFAIRPETRDVQFSVLTGFLIGRCSPNAPFVQFQTLTAEQP
jgi:hypothetical protein